VTVTVGIEEGGQAKSVLVHVIQVLDYYPSSTDNRYRNCQRQAAAAETVALEPGESHTFTRQFTITGVDWNNRDNVKVVAWARQPGSPAPREVYNANWVYLIQIPPGDLNGDGVIDLIDLALLLGSYGTCEGDGGYNPNADIDESGCVDLPDLATLLASYGYGT
jgi:hypothetical protein